MTNNNVGWTAQSAHGWVHNEGEPGQTFTEDQLPHPDVQRASGLDPDKYRQQHGLWVDEAAGDRVPVRGTETGRHPKEVVGTIGELESFRSYPEGLPAEDEQPGTEDDKKISRTPAKAKPTK